ncbi:prepilin-type N-terminal cleavage/methylation domain-containing protein [Mariniblastus sp.]|nr:prepilin-type N-terminal cleavage/methylation domain-containing protein [Mariniblastus sp.]
MQRPRTTTRSRSGLSLLEVILSLAILGVSMVAIGHLFNLGFRSAADMQLRSEANMIADSTMAEVAAGVIDFSSSGGAVESSPLWRYEIETQNSSQPGLLSVTVRVSLEDASTNNISVSLVRLIVDPDFEPDQEVATGSGSR